MYVEVEILMVSSGIFIDYKALFSFYNEIEFIQMQRSGDYLAFTVTSNITEKRNNGV